MEVPCQYNLYGPREYIARLREYIQSLVDRKLIIGERSEPHTYRTVGKNLRHIYIYVFYIYIYIYTFVRRARARYAQTSDRPVEVQRSI